MAEMTTCPQCGSAVPPDSPGGQCPRCLLSAGLEDEGSSARAAPPTPEEMGRHFPGLEVLEVLGQGGMGIVYKARQKHLDRLVALKVLPPEIAREPGFAERFTREARTLARLQHPHIVGVHDFGESDGLYYLLMEFVDGPNLRQVIRDGHLEPKQALAIVPQVCDALQYAHDRGIVHRDIKPENVLLDRQGRVKIADFGLAKLLERAPVDLTLTRSGQVMGTLHYMAPEQYKAPETVDHRADIYSLGVVFYEMLTGDLPLGTFPRPSEKAGVDARLDGIVLRALERERDRRWQHASDVRTQIDSMASSSAPAAAPAMPAPALGARPLEPVGGTRLSALALFGGLGAVLAIVAPAALYFAMAKPERPGSEDHGAALLAVIFAISVLVLAFAASIAALFRIPRSNGRLRGTGWAVTGVILVPVVSFFGMLSLTMAGPSGTAPGPGGASAAADPTLALKVIGGPPQWTDMDRARVAGEIEALWARLVPVIEREPNPDAKALALAPSDRDRVLAMDPAERRRAQEWGWLGVPFQARIIPQPSNFRLGWLVLEPGTQRGRAVMATMEYVLAFPVVRVDGTWYAALGAVEFQGRPPRPEDRSGWLDDRWYGARRDPAERVVGGPMALTDLDRHILAELVARAWRQADESHGTPLPITLPAGTRLSDYKVYSVALDLAGTKGRLVVSAGSWTMAFPIERGGGDDWTIVPDGDVKQGPAQPGDRDGALDR